MNIGLVLSGGMAKGALQVGALRAINEIIPREEIKCISCASVGTLNGYGYATDKLDTLETMWKEICGEESRLWINQILRSSLLQHDIKNIWSPEDVLPPEFYISLLDMNHESLLYKNISSEDQAKAARYLKASVAMPIFNKGIRMDGCNYYDGAVVDNIPVYPLLKRKLDYIIVIYFDEYIYRFENKQFDDRVIHLTFPVENFIKQSVVFTPEYVEGMIQSGYHHTKMMMRRMIGPDYQDTERIRKAILQHNSERKEAKVRVTGDLIVTNFNKLTQKLAKRKIQL